MKKKTVLITGSSGYLGTVLCRQLAETDWCGPVHGTDIRMPQARFDNFSFAQFDINDPRLVRWIVELTPDILVHLAFIVNPIHDETLMHTVNVGGTRAVLSAADRAGTPQILVASSGSAYGAWPDNPVPLTEKHPLRPVPGFAYARNKAEVEAVCAQFIEDHPDVAFSIIRPPTVYGPGVSNYLSDLITRLPVIVGLSGHNPPMQFVHEEDVAGAIIAILETGAEGPFNVVPPDTVTLEELMKIPRKAKVSLPDWVLRPMLKTAWALHIPLMNAPASFLAYMCHPWVLSSDRLTDETGYTFRYSSRETFEIMLRAKGVPM